MRKKLLNKLCITFIIFSFILSQAFLIPYFSRNDNSINEDSNSPAKVIATANNFATADALSTKEEIEDSLTEMEYSDESTDIIAKFDFNITDDATYQEISSKRYSCKTPDDIEAFREELNSYTYAYHRNILNKYIDILFFVSSFFARMGFLHSAKLFSCLNYSIKANRLQ